ncbi:TetR/AcrR family transcriptional regulator [Euzebya tangerina]|uniref:TetR/AcrR family transcriptional regulator n=1 Tax=Euzebya tangerina TaxID=591198 RepID=UPI000E3115A6|nr:TetR/AcrR family transcriptional regulator [Euzebya tangerina]
MAVTQSRATRGRATRRALVQASLELFDRHGVEGTSVDAITATADVAKGTFYVHFQRKQDVLLEWAAQLVEGIDPSALPEDAPAALADLGDHLASAMGGQSRQLIGRTIRELVGNYTDWTRVLGDRPTLWATITPIIERGQHAGTIRSDMSPLRLAMAITTLWLDSIVGWAERDQARPLGDSLALCTTLFLDGSRA